MVTHKEAIDKLKEIQEEVTRQYAYKNEYGDTIGVKNLSRPEVAIGALIDVLIELLEAEEK